MGSIGSAYQNAMLDAMFGDDHTADFPDTLWLTAWSTQVEDDGSGDIIPEAVALEVTNNSTNFPDAVGGVKKLAVDMDWDVADDWSAAFRFWALMDEEEDGQVVAWGRMSSTDAVMPVSGSRVTVIANAITISKKVGYR